MSAPGDKWRANSEGEPRSIGRAEPRDSDETVQAGDPDMVDSGDAIEGDRPVLEAFDTSGVTQTQLPTAHGDSTGVDALFGRDAAADFRARWDVVQRGFVDDPQQAVRDGDELVTQVIEALTQTFAAQRTDLESASKDRDSTETLRLALRRYRSFFERLLTI